MIHYFEEKRTFSLETKNLSYVFGLNDKGVPMHMYFGQKLCYPQELTLQRANDDERFKNAVGQFEYPQEYVTFGKGIYDEESIKLRYFDGVCDVELVYLNHSVCDDTLTVTLIDRAYELEVDLIYRLYTEIDFIERSAIIKNNGKPLTIENAASANFFLPSRVEYEVETFSGSHCREYIKQTNAIPNGKLVFETRRVVSSGPHHVPFFSIHEKEARIDEQNGRVYFGMLKYSGDFKLIFEKNMAQAVKITAGINFYDNEVSLSKGDCFETPSFLFSYTENGYGGMRRSMYELEYNELSSRNITSPFPIICNSWYPCLFDVEETKLLKVIDKANEIGAELFVIDDGWMRGRTSDNGGLGDWDVDFKRFPNGLRYISDYAHKKGMLFGLWAEPEMITEDSELYRKHPEWVLGYKTREPSYSRNQRVLDFSREDVYQYSKDTLDRIIVEYDLDYFKWDMNRYVCEKGAERDFGIKFTKNVMRLYRHLRTTYPSLLIENCAHGGARADFGLFEYCDRINRSDNADPVDVLRLHNSFIDMFPPRYAGGAGNVAQSPYYLNKRITPLKFRAELGMTGSMSIGFDLLKADGATIEEIKKYITYYKTIRPILHNSYLYKLSTPVPSKTYAWEYLSRNGEGAIVFIFGHGLNHGEKTLVIKPVALEPDACYTVRGTVYHGDTLMRTGINISMQGGDYQSEVIEIRKTEEFYGTRSFYD